MLIIIFSWIVLFIIIFLIGRLVLSRILLSFLGIKSGPEWYEYFWAGFVGVIGILQVWSIFLPVNLYSLVFVFALALFSLVFLIKKSLKFKLPDTKFIILGGITILVISYFASLPVGWYDTNLYHLNAVKWSNLYSIVPGLANLHTRLGFNTSFFLFASMIDNWILAGRSSHVAVSLLTVVLSLQIIWTFIKSENRILKIFSLFLIYILIANVFKTTAINSLSTDFVLAILAVAISLEFLERGLTSLLVAGLLSIILFTVKLSGISFAGLVLLFAIYRNAKLIWPFLGMGILLSVPFFIRNIILSGWVLYPVPIFQMNVPWALSKEAVSNIANIIKAWAILPGSGANGLVGQSFRQWFPGWLSRNTGAIELRILAFGFALVLIMLVAVAFRKISIDFKKDSGPILLIAASLVSVFYVLFTAPDLRFGGVFFWIFFAIAASLFINKFFHPKRTFEIILLLAIITFSLKSASPFSVGGKPLWRTVRWESSSSVIEKTISPSDGSPSFKILTPENGDRCGNSGLPCTPEINNDFKEIVPGDISKGFAPVN